MGKIVSQEELILLRREWKRNGLRIVFASGRFDLLHPGHIRFLEQGRSSGDILVVAVAADTTIQASEKKPIAPSAERAEILAALAAVDYVVEFEETLPHALLKNLAPDVVIKAGELKSGDTPSQDENEIRAIGAKIVRIPLEPGHSSEGLIERIRQLRA